MKEQKTRTVLRAIKRHGRWGYIKAPTKEPDLETLMKRYLESQDSNERKQNNGNT